ncbi:putative phytosulfokines 6 isoform X2 [Actinidia eriantha]|uniref:putative phytosulfokines 6 isoform X2 n=1 Tax=Actinidia eriantha TaxID=165200 RepID=UPI0025844F2A|nr:putative phytosulfokines 6 isoform X2 [Actinidia eriantha]
MPPVQHPQLLIRNLSLSLSLSLSLNLKLNTMKQNLNSFALLFFLLFLITTSQTLARSLPFKQGEEELKLNHEIITTEVSLAENKETDSLNLMEAVEDCQGGGEECLNRRMVAEAHLDYIYTQHQKP